VAVIQEAWIGGISTRRVDDLVQAMGLSGISKSQVSKLCKDIDERVHAFLSRPLTGEWPYLWLDATYLKQREGGRVVSVAAIIAVAVNTEGRREIVGLHIGPSEAEPFWSFFLKGLLRRGLSGVKLVISDAHEGLKAAIAKTFGATWQRCRVHWMRNALARVPKTQHAMVSAALRQAFLQPDAVSASQTWRHVADLLRGKWPKLASFMDESEHDVLAYMTFPAQHTRGKRGRRPIPADLPRVTVVHDLPEAEKTCPCGAALARIGEEVSEKLDIVPAKIQVVRHIRPKYACRACEGVRRRADGRNRAHAASDHPPKASSPRACSPMWR